MAGVLQIVATFWAGSSRNACAADEAQTAYRALVKHYHPDLVAHMATEFRLLAEERMKEINAAYVELRRIRGW
jgi:DnaJ-class molecular chaperone